MAKVTYAGIYDEKAPDVNFFGRSRGINSETRFGSALIQAAWALVHWWKRQPNAEGSVRCPGSHDRARTR